MRIRPDESEDKLCEVFRVVARVQLRVANARKGNFLSGPYRAIRELRRVGHSCTPLRGMAAIVMRAVCGVWQRS